MHTTSTHIKSLSDTLFAIFFFFIYSNILLRDVLKLALSLLCIFAIPCPDIFPSYMLVGKLRISSQVTKHRLFSDT